MPTYTFDIEPKAASRPRHSKYGHSYFVGPYKVFKERCSGLVPQTLGQGFTPLAGQLEVTVHCYVQRPKTTKLPTPRGDIDNFAKAVLDAMNGKLWEDDKQIEALHVYKTWTEGPDTEGYFTVATKDI